MCVKVTRRVTLFTNNVGRPSVPFHSIVHEEGLCANIWPNSHGRCSENTHERCEEDDLKKRHFELPLKETDCLAVCLYT